MVLWVPYLLNWFIDRGMQMKNGKKTIALLLSVMMIFSLTACGMEDSSKIIKYTSNVKLSEVEDGIIASNSNYEMRWNNKSTCVMITDIDKGYTWSTVPFDFYNGNSAGARAEVLLNSPINIRYITSPNNTIKTIYGSRVFEEGRISTKSIKNGIQVIYFFDDVEISIPVIYKLYDDHFSITVDPKGIMEGEQNKVYQIEIAPFLVSARANEDKNTYLFVPSGSGAVMYTDERDGSARVYEESVYGNDLAKMQDHITENTESVYMPTFGVSFGDKSLLGIIDEGASSCEISADAGDNTIGYAHACAVYTVRGHNTELVGMSQNATNRVNSYSDALINGKCTVSYFPLDNKENGYVSMAECYRDYLIKKYSLNSKKENSSIFLQIIGGATVDKSFIGIPYESLVPTTTLKQAEDIINEISEKIGIVPVVQLKGYGINGLNVGKIAGEYKISGKLGAYKDIRKLQSDNKNIFLDYDIVRFDKSSIGFSSLFNSAKAENGSTAYQYLYEIAKGNRNEKVGRYNLLSRNKLSLAFEKLNKVTDKNKVDNISLSTIGNMAYSDYRSTSFYSKGLMDKDVLKFIHEFISEKNLMTENAFDYAVVLSDYVISSPTQCSEYDSLDLAVPFYQIALRDVASLSTRPINLVSNPKKELLKAVESGIGLNYTVLKEYDSAFRKSNTYIAGCVYADNIDFIVSDYTRAKEILDLVKDSKIVSHKNLNENVFETVFDNGVTVVVNFGKTEAETTLGNVGAESYVFKK